MNLHGIDLNLLVAFDAINAERNVTRAGARIGRTQPAMSAALARLRDLLKDELFVRGPSGLQPTPRAAELAEPIATALRDIQRTLDFTQDFDPSTVRTTFSLGLSGHAGSVVLPRLLAVLAARAPGVDLTVREYDSRDAAIDLLDVGDVDLTVGIPLSASSRILNARLFQERYVCILRKNHPATGRALDTQTFLSLNHIQIAPDTDGLDVADAALATKGMRRRVALTVPQMASAPQLVASSDMLAIVMEGVVANSGFADRLTMVDFPLPLNPVPFVMSWHRRNDAHPAQRWIRNALLGAFPHVWLASENLCGDLVQPYY
ncbi:LysR family transcriptional regulator [Rhizobium sp. G21]|uniref:LysR family transcriptional regulator n=1 Tax=Rhizobium sp. G21 TaxID=2758439 RepID=UPI001601538C|nr:LysR family transcriptional regulator [Rhizobium sp. G21]MBB1250544.1 LysR family transcriptional regulator [Rhizobium sp. G21]